MAKHAKKTLPKGYAPSDFIYMGRAAKDQGDFGSDVGLADMRCVNQFGANNDKYYHAGVLRTSDGKWWMYTEWGRYRAGKSWDGTCAASDFQFEEYSTESEARRAFASKANDKNTKRIVQKSPGVWTGKAGKDGYLVQDLATREKGLPDAYKIKDDCGLAKSLPAPKAAAKTAPKIIAKTSNHHPEVVSLCQALVGGTKSYVKRATEASGVLPTIRAIEKVRDILIPEALVHIERVSSKCKPRANESQDTYENRLALACTANTDLQDISKMVASLVPMPIPARADAQTRALATILSNSNIFRIQQDLDTYESSLRNEDWGTTQEQSSDLDIEARLGASVGFVEWTSEEGKWLLERWQNQTKNRHHQYKNMRLKRAFTLGRPRFDDKFVASAKKVHDARKGEHIVDFADMQSPRVSEDIAKYPQAKVAWLFHGTRSVNVDPILKTDLKLPKSLKGVPIQGAAFGHGLYWACDKSKSISYCSNNNAIYAGDGGIKGRGAFMFFGEVILGKPYRASRAGVLSDCPRGYDSVFASDKWCSTLLNDEHVVWGTSEGPSHRLRYLLEFE